MLQSGFRNDELYPSTGFVGNCSTVPCFTVWTTCEDNNRFKGDEMKATAWGSLSVNCQVDLTDTG
eukprot:scaffold1717_cov117-Cylindrotheca_fusiformis.AAC.15